MQTPDGRAPAAAVAVAAVAGTTARISAARPPCPRRSMRQAQARACLGTRSSSTRLTAQATAEAARRPARWPCAWVQPAPSARASGLRLVPLTVSGRRSADRRGCPRRPRRPSRQMTPGGESPRPRAHPRQRFATRPGCLIWRSVAARSTQNIPGLHIACTSPHAAPVIIS